MGRRHNRMAVGPVSPDEPTAVIWRDGSLAPNSNVLLINSCPSRKSYPGVAMMQSAQNRRGDDRSVSLDSASSRCVLVQSQVRAGFVIVKRI
jgi:hypothetical protein